MIADVSPDALVLAVCAVALLLASGVAERAAERYERAGEGDSPIGRFQVATALVLWVVALLLVLVAVALAVGAS